MKWILVATAPNQTTAESWCALLKEAGIAARVRASDAISFMGVSSLPCGVMVPEAEKARAEFILKTEP